jgi:hypothetical protein
MEFANDLIGALRNRLGEARSPGEAVHPEWFGLRMRYAAAHAARRELLRNAQALHAARAGSFGRSAAAALLAGHDAVPGVNPNALVDGKHPAGNEGAVAGAPTDGDRGQ